MLKHNVMSQVLRRRSKSFFFKHQ